MLPCDSSFGAFVTQWRDCVGQEVGSPAAAGLRSAHWSLAVRIELVLLGQKSPASGREGVLHAEAGRHPLGIVGPKVRGHGIYECALTSRAREQGALSYVAALT